MAIAVDGRLPSVPQQGKVPREFLDKAVYSHLGAHRSSLIVGPGHGLDNAVVSIGENQVLLVTSDPISVIPAIGFRESARLSIHLIASDLASSGVAPQFAVLDANLPPEMDLHSVASYVKALGDECGTLGITVAGGHTGRYPGSGYTVVGGGMMFSVAKREDYVTPAMAKAGDVVVMTKGAAIGATAVLAHSFPRTIGKKTGEGLLEKARARLSECSTVEDSLASASIGLHERVTSMHDATEGGVLGGLVELSMACGLPIVADRREIHVSVDAESVCAVFGLDPLTSTSEGTLLITCRPQTVGELQNVLRAKEIASWQIGRVQPRGGESGLFLTEGGAKKPRRYLPSPDRYWVTYSRAVAQGLR